MGICSKERIQTNKRVGRDKEEEEMIEGLIKLSGCLFIGGIGLGLIFVFTMLLMVLTKDFLKKMNER